MKRSLQRKIGKGSGLIREKSKNFFTGIKIHGNGDSGFYKMYDKSGEKKQADAYFQKMEEQKKQMGDLSYTAEKIHGYLGIQ